MNIMAGRAILVAKRALRLLLHRLRKFIRGYSLMRITLARNLIGVRSLRRIFPFTPNVAKKTNAYGYHIAASSLCFGCDSCV